MLTELLPEQLEFKGLLSDEEDENDINVGGPADIDEDEDEDDDDEALADAADDEANPTEE